MLLRVWLNCVRDYPIFGCPYNPSGDLESKTGPTEWFGTLMLVNCLVVICLFSASVPFVLVIF